MEINKEIKARIFAQYYGVKVMYVGGVGLVEVGNGGWNLKHPDFFLQLKPLSSISDEDAFECLKIKNKYSNSMPFVKIKLKERHNYSIQFICSYHKFSDNVEFLNLYDFTVPVYQYLQSKSYALPYMEYSVEDLIKAGIYKLTKTP